MKTSCKRTRLCLYTGLGLLALIAAAGGLWASISYTPKFYRKLVAIPDDKREQQAKNFVRQSLQLRNDIVNEPSWEAVFTDLEVNAWLAEDLVLYFADQLPREVHEPRIAFETDRVTLAFQVDQGPIHSVIWVVARPNIPEDNVLSLTLEKIRAGSLPVPPERMIERLTKLARDNKLEISWSKDGELPMATIRFPTGPRKGTDSVVLEQVNLRNGQIRLAGRSNRQTAALPTILPGRQSLQESLPKRTTQPAPEPPPAAPAEGYALPPPAELVPNATGPSN